MPNSLQLVSIDAPAGPIQAAVGIPAAGGPHPVVVVLQEAFGFTEQIRGVAKRLVDAGFAAVVPDLYSRDALRQELSDADVALGFPVFRRADREVAYSALPHDQQPIARKVVEWLENRDASQYLSDSLAALEWARNHPSLARHRAAVIGFCMGGGLVGQIASSGAKLAAGVVFYGQVPSSEAAASIEIPLLGNYAETDPSITPKVPDFAAALERRGIEFSYTVHPGTSHGFFNETRAAFHEQASARAWEDTLRFLHRHLSPRA